MATPQHAMLSLFDTDMAMHKHLETPIDPSQPSTKDSRRNTWPYSGFYTTDASSYNSLATTLLPGQKETSDASTLSISSSDNHEDRLWCEIHYTSQWGAITGSLGMARLSLTDHDRAVRDYFVAEALSIGCKVQIDQIGNIFARLAGQNDDISPIGIGSHLDTQPAGGRFDGVLGVLGALEVLRSIVRSGKKTYAPVAAINWTNEEGARFTPGCTGSAVWASHTPLSQALELSDPSSDRSMGQELERIGYSGDVCADYQKNPLCAHFELHIEQRRCLQDMDKKIGVVTGIQGIRWYRVVISGERAHAGSEMCDRGDALAIAAEVIVFTQEKALQVSAVATTGVIDLDKPSPNTVPGVAVFTIDIRHKSETVLNDFESAINGHLAKLQKENVKISSEITRLWRSPAVDMHEEAVSCTRKAASKVVGDDLTMDLLSLAGHDSALVAMRVPTSMIFVPSRDGISHAPEEYTSKEECALGVQVLTEAVLEFDARLHQVLREAS